MNKKILAVVAVSAVTAVFWACGQGEIYEPLGAESAFLADPSAMPSGLAVCLASKTNCDGAFKKEETPEDTSSTEDPIQGGDNTDFVDTTTIEIGGGDDDIGEIPVNPIDTVAVPEVTGLGSCSPATAAISKGVADAGQFKFTPNTTTSGYTGMKFATASYEWSFEGAPTVNAGDKVNANSAHLTYANSGSYGASVIVSMPDGATETIACSPIQVNGDPITGCSCTTDVVGTVDFQATPNVSWKVSGCKSNSAINSYTWEGTAGTETYTHTFTKATDGFAPKLVVGNADKTVQSVTCPAVRVSDGPEYAFHITRTGGQTKVKETSLSIPDGGCMVINYTFEPSYDGDKPSVRVSCEAGRSSCDVDVQVNNQCPSDVSLTLTYGTQTKSSTKSSSNVNLQDFIPNEALKQGEDLTLSKMVCVGLTGNSIKAATCKLSVY